MQVTARRLSGFDECNADEWASLLLQGETKSVFLTLPWQKAWWQTFGRGQLLLISIEMENKQVAIASLFADSGMVFFVGSGGSDYLDFIGDTSQPQILRNILEMARDCTENFLGFRFYHVPDGSKTGQRLAQVAKEMEFDCFDEGELPAPRLRFSDWPPSERPPAEKKSLVRHDRSLRSKGSFQIRHLQRVEDICPFLSTFFEQHIARWSTTPYPSLFLDPLQRHYYTCLTNLAAASGCLRFTSVQVDDQPVAFHFGTCFDGTFLWYKPSFDVNWAAYSPGEVLLRHLILYAEEIGAHTFDFGLGDEAFKQRFATEVRWVRNWGLYPRNLEKSGAAT